MKLFYLVLNALWIILIPANISLAQKDSNCPGWTGEVIIPDEVFYDQSNWIPNASAGSSCNVVVSDTSVDLHWKLISGNDQWIQCYIVLPEPVFLSKYDLFGFDLHGSACDSAYPCHKEQVVEIKFEDGSLQASHTRMGEDGILCVDRWVNRLFFHKYDDDFSIPEGFNWDHVQVLSFGVKSHPWVDNPPADSGIVSFRNFVADSTGGWIRPTGKEILNVHPDTLEMIRQDALDFILSRQTSTGLLTTWTEGGLSWLYGQGLALKILTIEGEWDSEHNPVNAAAEAAQKLARFLANHQQNAGYWPRAWNSYTGDSVVLYEDDGTIWMGDFPWILTGLYSYFKKSNDCDVLNPVNKGETFFRSLIDPDGKFYTLNVPDDERIPVTSSEAYAAAIGALIELGDDELAEKLITYIHNETWDSNLLYWKEGVYSDRVVLFANTWLALLMYNRGYKQESLSALKLAGSLMYTCGPGEPCGLDGIGPIAVWYEGTLSYIAAGGCGSNTLFNNIRPFINNDGSVPHYNDDIGSNAGIWAEKWSSLDGTSWLYFVAAQKSPFEALIPEHDPFCVDNVENEYNEFSLVHLYPNPCSNYIEFTVSDIVNGSVSVIIINGMGQTLIKRIYNREQGSFKIDLRELVQGVYFFRVESSNKVYVTKFSKE